MATIGIMPITSLIAGALAVQTGAHAVLWATALLVVLGPIPIIASPMRRWNTFPGRSRCQCDGGPKLGLRSAAAHPAPLPYG